MCNFFSHFHRFIIGFKGGTLKRLGSETNTRIIVPKLGQDGDIGKNYRIYNSKLFFIIRIKKKL